MIAGITSVGGDAVAIGIVPDPGGRMRHARASHAAGGAS